MPQIFPPSANVLAKASIVVFALTLVVAGAVAWTFYNSLYVTGQFVAVAQPVPFSHEHHVGQLGFDCRYCHTSAETSAFAGIPPTETCMNCHTQVWSKAPMLAPVRDSYRLDRPLVWHRVYNLPDFAYFDHHVHLAKGVGCVSCHGRVDRMPVLYQDPPLTMRWCLDCHDDPQPNLRPRDEVFNVAWTPPPDVGRLRRRWMREYDVQRRIDCSTCHR